MSATLASPPMRSQQAPLNAPDGLDMDIPFSIDAGEPLSNQEQEEEAVPSSAEPIAVSAADCPVTAASSAIAQSLANSHSEPAMTSSSSAAHAVAPVKQSSISRHPSAASAAVAAPVKSSSSSSPDSIMQYVVSADTLARASNSRMAATEQHLVSLQSALKSEREETSRQLKAMREALELKALQLEALQLKQLKAMQEALLGMYQQRPSSRPPTAPQIAAAAAAAAPRPATKSDIRELEVSAAASEHRAKSSSKKAKSSKSDRYPIGDDGIDEPEEHEEEHKSAVKPDRRHEPSSSKSERRNVSPAGRDSEMRKVTFYAKAKVSGAKHSRDEDDAAVTVDIPDEYVPRQRHSDESREEYGKYTASFFRNMSEDILQQYYPTRYRERTNRRISRAKKAEEKRVEAEEKKTRELLEHSSEHEESDADSHRNKRPKHSEAPRTKYVPAAPASPRKPAPKQAAPKPAAAAAASSSSSSSKYAAKPVPQPRHASPAKKVDRYAGVHSDASDAEGTDSDADSGSHQDNADDSESEME